MILLRQWHIQHWIQLNILIINLICVRRSVAIAHDGVPVVCTTRNGASTDSNNLVIYSVWPQCTPYHLEQLPNPTISISHRVELCTHPSQTPQREPFSINCNLGNLVNQESLRISYTTHDTSTLIISRFNLKIARHIIHHFIVSSCVWTWLS